MDDKIKDHIINDLYIMAYYAFQINTIIQNTHLFLFSLYHVMDEVKIFSYFFIVVFMHIN